MSFGNLKTLQISSFLKLNRLRLQLLLRIHTAHLHQKSKVSKSSDNREGIMVSNLSEIRSSEKVGGDLLTAATLSMSLSILETLGSSREYSILFIVYHIDIFLITMLPFCLQTRNCLIKYLPI